MIDKVVDKAVSRKLLAFGLASIFLTYGFLDSDHWALITCIYIGAQGAIDFYQVFKGMQPTTSVELSETISSP